MKKLHNIPVLNDNYIWLLENQHQQTVIIDPAEAEPVIDYHKKHHLHPIGIMLTHHHSDHIGGVTALQEQYPHICVYGPTQVNLAIHFITHQDKVDIADFHFTVISVPGHTKTHLAYYLKPYLFSGDCLFSAGCGRVFEGTYEQMFDSLNKLKQLPDETQICAGHEYTRSNLQFAQKMVPENQDIRDYLAQINDEKVTLPSLLSVEKKINLFLNCNNQILKNKFNINSDLEMFSFFRIQKDKF